jgi:hypothetical protein
VAAVMNRPCYQFLSGAAGTGDENRAVGIGNFFYYIKLFF